VGYEGISTLPIPPSRLSKTVLTTSCQGHHRLKHFPIAHFTFIRMVILTKPNKILAVNPYRNHPGSSNKQARPFEPVLELPNKLTIAEIRTNIDLLTGPLDLFSDSKSGSINGGTGHLELKGAKK